MPLSYFGKVAFKSRCVIILRTHHHSYHYNYCYYCYYCCCYSYSYLLCDQQHWVLLNASSRHSINLMARCVVVQGIQEGLKGHTSEVGGMHRVCMWRVKREDMSCLPPPGGAQAAMIVMSSMPFQKSLLLS